MDEYDPANIKLAHQVRWDAPDDDLLFCKQIGLRWVRLDYGLQDPRVDAVRQVQQRFAEYGLGIYSARHSAYQSLKIQLGRPGRDEDIHTYHTFLRSLGELGIGVAVYDFHPANTYTTARVERRGYIAREFDVATFRNTVESNRFEREYSAEEMWDNYAYFMRAALPVAQEADVALALHPDDPPLAMMNGVAKLFYSYDGYHRAEEIASDTGHWGLKFCVGTWAEGGDQMGKDVFGMIADFGARGRILDVDFRNVSGVMPRFVEAFPDDGDWDLYAVMRALRQVGYAGIVVPDHIPQLAGDDALRRGGLAYCIASMRAMLKRANEDVG